MMKRSLLFLTCFSKVAIGFHTTKPLRNVHHHHLITTKAQLPKNVMPKAQRKSITQHRYSLLSQVDQFFIDSPYTAAALVCGIKASAADGVAQFQEWKDTLLLQEEEEEGEKRKGLAVQADWRRNIAFVTYGAAYQGLTQEFIFNHVYPIWFGTGTEWTVVLTKVAFTLLVVTTLLTLPSLYVIKGVIEQSSLKKALGKYVDDVKNQKLLQKFYMLWGPVLTLAFSVVPEQFRIAFIAVISFFWLIILSGISSGSTPAEKDALCAVGQDVCEFEYKSKNRN
mmetsp:Transcript_37241/g.56816  ORF Transcript_37241/g.56816 Transcript_37241/m.56816 type:complete len:281 (-) Transcript_37241:31-873(-)